MAVCHGNRATSSFFSTSTSSTCLMIIVFSFLQVLVSSSRINAQNSPPKTTRLTDLFPHLSFKDEMSELFGGKNVQLDAKGSSASITLDKRSGSGLGSKSKYYYGFFSASMKLPAGITSGVVVAFYLTNSDVHRFNHDEVDFELLGHENRKYWVLQTNIYGNGSVSTGREEKFRLWFDPTTQFHEYSIIWNAHHVVFLIDNIPVREVIHTPTMTAYPSKPMSLLATIWDASDWATSGGKSPVNYRYAPYTASFANLEMNGCVFNPNATTTGGRGKGSAGCVKNPSGTTTDPVQGQNFAKLSDEQVKGLQWARNRFLIYSYCNDVKRYKVLPPECKQTN